GRSAIGRPLYLPKGIWRVTSSCRSSGCMKGLLQVVPGQYTDAGRPALVGRGMADPAHAGLVAGEESACNLRASRYNSAARISRVRYGAPVGPLATIRREPGQARKGAAVAVPSCAGVWLAGLPPLFPPPSVVLHWSPLSSILPCTQPVTGHSASFDCDDTFLVFAQWCSSIQNHPAGRLQPNNNKKRAFS